MKLHLIAYYWAASVALSIGPGDISAQNGNEMFFVCCVVVLGEQIINNVWFLKDFYNLESRKL